MGAEIGLEDLRGEKRIDFLPWMHYQPLVEVEWAAKIVQGMATFAGCLAIKGKVLFFIHLSPPADTQR